MHPTVGQDAQVIFTRLLIISVSKASATDSKSSLVFMGSYSLTHLARIYQLCDRVQQKISRSRLDSSLCNSESLSHACSQNW